MHDSMRLLRSVTPCFRRLGARIPAWVFPTTKVHRVQLEMRLGTRSKLAFTNRVILQHYSFQHLFNVCWLLDKAPLWKREMLKLSTLLPPQEKECNTQLINMTWPGPQKLVAMRVWPRLPHELKKNKQHFVFKRNYVHMNPPRPP